MLQSKKESLVNSMTEIDLVMHEKLKPFSQETLEHEQEYQHLDAKRNEIAEKEVSGLNFVIHLNTYSVSAHAR